jgi:putative ABC transport system ATP-binding protein
MSIIEADGLLKGYRGDGPQVEVLRDLSFRVEPGEFVAITGASGSGKSTLLNILGLLDRPDGGSYRFDGREWSGASDDDLSDARNRRIGFVFQQFHLLDRDTALRNVTLPLVYAEGDVGDVRARGEKALAAVGLAHRVEHRPFEMSGGEQQRVAVARALINDPALILADEPTGNLDTAAGEEVVGLFRRLHDEGRTIIMVTHDPAVAARADRVLVLEDGRMAS